MSGEDIFSFLEIVSYCFKYSDCIYIRKGKENVKLGNLSFEEAIKFIVGWIERGSVPHRVVSDCKEEVTP